MAWEPDNSSSAFAGKAPRIVRPDPRQTIWNALGYGGNGVSFSTWAGKRIAQRVGGNDDLDEVFRLPIYASPLRYSNLFETIQSEAVACQSRALIRPWCAKVRENKP